MTVLAESPHRESLCGVKGGVGIGAGHVCICIRKAGHPCDTSRPHACDCGALWAEPVPDDVPVGVLGESTVDRIAEIRARLVELPKEPWITDGAEVYTVNCEWLAEACDPEVPYVGELIAKFIAHARTDIPWLLDEVERLRGWEAVADALAKHLEELRNRCEPETVFGSLVTYLGTKAQQV